MPVIGSVSRFGVLVCDLSGRGNSGDSGVALVLFRSTFALDGVRFGEFFCLDLSQQIFVPCEAGGEVQHFKPPWHRNIFGLLDEDQSIRANRGTRWRSTMQFALGVNFSYDGQQPVLRDVSFQFVAARRLRGW